MITDLVRIAGGIINCTNDDVDAAAADATPSPDVDRGGETTAQIRARQLAECRATLSDVRHDEDDDLADAVQQLEHIAASIVDLAQRLPARAPAGRGAPRVQADGNMNQERRILEDALAAREAVTKGMEKAAAHARTAAREKWRTWLLANIDSGARNAHKFLRIPEPWRPTTTIVTDGVVTADPMKLLEAYRSKYLKLWDGADADEVTVHHSAVSAALDPGEHRPDDAPWRASTRTPLVKLTPERLREASLSFKAHTMSTYDGIAMRQYALLSDAALSGLAELFEVLEITARLPPQTRLTTMPLIGKTRGGHRTVGSLPSNYRLWTRSRKGMIAEWEARNERAFIAAGSGRGPQDAVWRQAARAESMARKGGYAATLLWDMASYYESLRRVPLWHRARRLGFPQVLLDVALTTYEGPRMLCLSGALSRAVVAKHGVVAGCSFANALTRAYSIEACDRVARTIAEIPAEDSAMDMFVDDLAVTITGTYDQVVSGMSQAKEALQHEVEVTLQCSIETSKAAVATSHAGLTKILARRFGDLAGPSGTRCTRRAAVNLGIDYAAGRARRALGASGRRRRRMNNLATKSRRLARIRALLGRRAPTVFATGQLAEAEYGAAVHGFTDSEVVKLHRAAAQALTPRARGRSLRRTILLAGAPTWRAETAIIAQYARQVWQAVTRRPEDLNGGMSLAEIAKTWRGAQNSDIIDADTGRRHWQRTRGPISSMMLSLHRIGWTMTSPFIMQDHKKQDIVLTKVSPALLMTMLKAAVLAALERAEGRSIAKHDPAFIDRRLGVEHVAQQLRTDRKMTPADVAAYKAVACGAVMTYSRAADLGYAVDDICPLCGMAGDTLRHRIWRCTHPDAVRARCQHAPEWLQREQERRPLSDSLWTTGWIPHPADVWPQPSDTPTAHIFRGESVEGDDPPPEGAPRGLCGHLYGDGSCTTHVFAELRRAGSSVVQRDPGAAVVQRVRCPVAAPLPQTPQAAEYMVVALAQQLAQRNKRIDLAVDCLNVVRDMNAPYAVAASARRMQAGISRVALADKEFTGNVHVRKVKAHVKPENASTQADKEDAIGNNWADEEAKAAVLLHPQPPPAAVASLEAELRRSRLIVRTIAKVSQAFPSMPKERMVKLPASVEGATLKIDGSHDWSYVDGLWRCRCCLKLTLEPHLTRQLALQRCAGPKQSVQVEAMIGLGHVVARTATEIPIVFCLKCGAFTARRAYGLAAPCKGRPSPPGAQALARIRKGLQPWQRRSERRGRTSTDTEAWTGAGGGFTPAGPTSGGRRRKRNDHNEQRDEHDDERERAHPRARVGEAPNGDDHDGCVARPPASEPEARGGGAEARGGGATTPVENHDQHMRDEFGDEDPFGHGGSLEEHGQDARGHSLVRSGQAPPSAARRVDVASVATSCRLTNGGGQQAGRGRGDIEAADDRVRRLSFPTSDHVGADMGPPPAWWTDPPSWMYLPHLYPPRPTMRAEEPVRPSHDERDDQPSAATDRRPEKRARRWNASQAHEEANEYVMRSVFEEHRLRTERKRAASGQGDGAPAASAQQRLEAIRRRVKERADMQASNRGGALEMQQRPSGEQQAQRHAASSTDDDFVAGGGVVVGARKETVEVQARASVTVGANARAGPGDPPARGSTVAAAEPPEATVAATVARAGVAATPHRQKNARPDLTGRGEAAFGPPGGFAAPPEDLGMVVDSSLGREVETTLQEKPHARSGGGPQEGQRELSPQDTPEVRLGVGPSNGKHYHDEDGDPTHTGERRGGGMALASPRPSPQQRVAATPQLGTATDSSPKGVESTTTRALAVEREVVSEQDDTHHHGARRSVATGSGSRQGAGDQAARSILIEAASSSVGATPADNATAVRERSPMDGGTETLAKRRRRWEHGSGEDTARDYHLRAGSGGRARMLAHLRGRPRPGELGLPPEAELGDRHDAGRYLERGLRGRHHGSRLPSPRRRGGTDGMGGVSGHVHGFGRRECSSNFENVKSRIQGTEQRGGGRNLDLDAAPSLFISEPGGACGAALPASSGGADSSHSGERASGFGHGLGGGGRRAATGGEADRHSDGWHRGGEGRDGSSAHAGQFQRRRGPLESEPRDARAGDRQRLIEGLRGGEPPQLSRTRIGVAKEPGQQPGTNGIDDAQRPEAGSSSRPSNATSPSKECGLTWSGRGRGADASPPSGANRDYDGGHGGGAVKEATTRRHLHMPNEGKPRDRGGAEASVARDANSHGQATGAREEIRGQETLPGPRRAGSQCSDGLHYTSNEDAKIHPLGVHVGRIDYPAYQSRGAVGDANATAVEVAARLVAWHTDAASEPSVGDG